MGYSLPDHELFILNREYGISYRKLAEEWKCGQSTIGNHVRQFEELLENEEPRTIAFYEATSIRFQDKDYQNMIADMQIEGEVGQILEIESAEDMMPVGIREKTEQGFWKSVWSVLKEIVWW